MKKLVSLLLSLVLVFSCSFVTHATSINYDHSDEDIQIVTPESFASFFSTDTIDEVLYNYTLVPQEEAEADIANVTLVFEFKIDDKSYGTSISGTVNGYRLESEDVLWHGPLKGTVNIDGTIYKVIVGFSKLNSNENTGFTVTVQSDHATNNENDFFAFIFGESVITKSIWNELSQNSSIDSSNSSESISMQNPTVETNGLGDIVIYEPGAFRMPVQTANGSLTHRHCPLLPDRGLMVGDYNHEPIFGFKTMHWL